MKERTEHTPGPWESRVSPTKDLIVQVNDDSRLFPPMIATVCNWMNDIEAVKLEAQANAQLIAAAPELLLALEVLVKMVSDGDWTTIELDQARAIIAKAKGQA